MVRLLNCDIETFKKYCKDRNIICVGAGKVCNDFLKKNSDILINSIIDNDGNKWGKIIEVESQNIPIISMEEAKSISNIVLLISCADISSVMEQLDKCEYFNNVECFAVYYLQSQSNWIEEKERKESIKYRLTEQMMIPKRIHYCWFGGGEIPNFNKRCINSWKDMCPDYEFIFWNEKNYDVKKNAFMRQAYEAKKWSFVTDYARMDLLYNYGGIYLDTDVELIKKIDHLLYQKAFVGVDSTKRISSGLGIGSIKGNPVIKKIMDKYETIGFDINNMIPCPEIEKSIYESLGFIPNGAYQILDGITVFPEKVLSGKCDVTGRILLTEETVAIHHFDGSWNDEIKRTRRYMNKKIYKDRVREISL